MIIIARRGLYLVGILSVLLACKATDKKTGATSGSAAATPPTAAATTSAAAGDDNKPKTNFSGPKDAKGVDLAKILGTKSDGWQIPAFSKLKEHMTPAEAGKVLPGAEKIDEFGFSEIKKTDVKGVSLYKLSFLDHEGKKALAFATIEFDPKYNDEPFWVALASHLKEKLNADLTDNGGHHINWVGPGMNLWSLSKGITHEGYELTIAIGK